MREEEPKPQVQTCEEIAAIFPGEWVLMHVAFIDESLNFQGYSIYHNPDRTEVFDHMAQISSQESPEKKRIYRIYSNVQMVLSLSEEDEQKASQNPEIDIFPTEELEMDSLERLLEDMGKYDIEEESQ